MKIKKIKINGWGIVEFEVIPIKCKIGDTIWFDDDGRYLEGIVNKIEPDEYWIDEADEDTPEKKHYGRVSVTCTTENSYFKGQNFLIYADEIIYEKPNEVSTDVEKIKRIPFSYKEIDNKSKEKYPEDVWNRYAFKSGALWVVENIFKDMTRDEIIEEMGIPTITCDDKIDIQK